MSAKEYVITEIKKSGHYVFVNDLGKKDLAHPTWFLEVVEKKTLKRPFGRK